MKPKEAPTVVYTTFPDITHAKRVGGELVEHGLAACVNILPQMTSIYRWEGNLETAEEVVAIVKTQSAQTAAVIAAIEAAHPYDTPAILSWEATSGSAGYIDWIMQSTRSGERS